MMNKIMQQYLMHPWVYWIAIIINNGEKIKTKGIITRNKSNGAKQKKGVAKIVTIILKNNRGTNNKISK
jgi:hypothetical protein